MVDLYSGACQSRKPSTVSNSIKRRDIWTTEIVEATKKVNRTSSRGYHKNVGILDSFIGFFSEIKEGRYLAMSRTAHMKSSIRKNLKSTRVYIELHHLQYFTLGDLLDELWINRFNEAHPNEELKIKQLVDVLNFLENDCHQVILISFFSANRLFQNLHLALIEILNGRISQNLVDEDAACDICRTVRV